jgi:hypothetical protein
MTSAFSGRFDELNQWRDAVRARLDGLAAFLAEQGPSDVVEQSQIASLRQRLSTDKLVVAFVGEFSRGKSELINAIFFADTGRRVLPATPGRTTMCPVELSNDPTQPITVSLLPIASRLSGASLAELRRTPQAWTHVPLDAGHPEHLSSALREVMGTQRLSIAEALALGLWDETNADNNPKPDDSGRVEIPAWRHALINYPHPLLRQGLVVLDTPGLNALGAEPELTLSLLPSAHATVFVVGADTGVTQSDMAIWRDHLGSRQGATFVVLNKIDALRDPLLTPLQVAAHIEAQRTATARALGVPVQRVFALSARQALVARVESDAQSLAASHVAEFEAALSAELLPQRQQVLQRLINDTVTQLQQRAARRLGDARRQIAEQMLELRGLRGKSSGRLRTIRQRIEQEALEFEHCHSRLLALRGLHSRLLETALEGLSEDQLKAEVDRFLADIKVSMLKLGARKAFVAACARLRERLMKAGQQAQEIREMLAGTFTHLNAEFGFGLVLMPGPDLSRFVDELNAIERSYTQYLGLGQALRLSQPQFMVQFRRMLLSRLDPAWDGARSDIESWNGAMTTHVEVQLHERRRSFQKRAEALSRIRGASDELELRITDIEQQDEKLKSRSERLAVVAQAVLSSASTVVACEGNIDVSLPVDEFISVRQAHA